MLNVLTDLPNPVDMLVDPISLIVFAIYAALMVWEAVLPARSLPKIRFWKLKGLISFMVFFYLSSYLPLIWDQYLAQYQVFDLTSLGRIRGALVGLLIYELGLYAWHYAMHKSNALWRIFHQMHHSAERIDTYGAFYFSPMDMIGFTFLGSLSLVVVAGFTPEASTLFILSTTFLSIFQHSNINTPSWIGYFIQRPEAHAIHHAKGIHAYNYSDIPLYDMLFGTFRNPKSFENENGFYPGASSRVKDMLLFKDINKEPITRGAKRTAKILGVIILFLLGLNQATANYNDKGKRRVQLANGISMAYVDAGNPQGEVVLLLHGYTDTSRSFKNVIDEMLKFNPALRIIAPDLRGHGLTSVPIDASFSMEDFKNDLIDLLDQLKIAKVNLVGHSMGSMVAQKLAFENPERVNKVVLIGTFSNGKDNPVLNDFLSKSMLEEDWSERIINKFGEDGLQKLNKITPKDLGDEVVSFLKENWVTEARATERLLSEILEDAINTPLITWFRALEEQSSLDQTIELSNISLPMLVLWGGDDVIFPEHPDQKSVKDAISSAYYSKYTPVFYKSYRKVSQDDPDIGHNLHWGIAEYIAEDIVEFIKKTNPVPAKQRDSIKTAIELSKS